MASPRRGESRSHRHDCLRPPAGFRLEARALPCAGRYRTTHYRMERNCRMSTLAPWYEGGPRMVEAGVADLYGNAEHDLLDEEPLERFIVGILHPCTTEG